MIATTATPIEIGYADDACSGCGGDGTVLEPCTECDGNCWDDNDDTCSECVGSGETEEACWTCDGMGTVDPPRSFEAFTEVMEPVFQAIADAGIGVTVPDGSGNQCCQGCIVATAQRGRRGGWVGFHDQDLEHALNDGGLYVSHDLPNMDDLDLVVTLFEKHFRLEWDGTLAQRFQLHWD